MVGVRPHEAHQGLAVRIMRNIGRVLLILTMVYLFMVSLTALGLSVPSQTHTDLEQRPLMDSVHALELTRQSPGFSDNSPEGPDLSGGAPDGVLYSGRGVALKDNEPHDLMLNVANLMPSEPNAMRKLLESNKSIDEIQEEINAAQRASTYRGSMWLDGRIYPLINIKVAFSKDINTELYADVIEPMPDSTVINETAISGNITVSIEPSESGMIGKGDLIMIKGPQVGSYHIMLDMIPIDDGARKQDAPGRET